jgi:hypothetical protein
MEIGVLGIYGSPYQIITNKKSRINDPGFFI